jgi:thiamine pyrophosphokinase
MPTYFIIGSGSVDPLPYYQEIIRQCDVIIGVDGGANHLFALKQSPDWVMGDNDSIADSTLHWLKTEGIPIIVYPSEKDKSDFELAVEKIISESSKGIVYLAAMLGGRIDHTLLNIDVGRKLRQSGFQPIFISEHTWIRIIQGREFVKGLGIKGNILSLISLSDFVWIKQTINLKYSLSNEKIEKLSSEGLSNVLLSDHFGLEVLEGEALLVYHSEVQKVSPLLFQQGGV